MTNIYYSASPCAIFATRLSSQAVYFIQTGGSALSNTYKAEKPSVCLSVCTFWHADISAVSARIDTGLARNESCVFEDHKLYF